MDLPFRKYHGLGNDFIVVFALDPLEPLDQLDAHAIELCDRHRGVGADGVLLVLPARGSGSQATMRVLNADGSEPEMCGNGLRCVAAALANHHAPLAGRAELLIDTGAGALRCLLFRDPGDDVNEVEVEMGQPSLERSDIGLEGDGRFVQEQIELDGSRSFVGTAVSMGNPHFVIFIDDPDEDLRQLALHFGPLLESHPLFANRTNVEFARIAAGEMELWVWERGCGLTQACGTGACAAAVAAKVTERFVGHRQIVRLPGGKLDISVADDLSGVRMRGPAVEVYSGTITL